jgi:hypothetical protein
LEVTLSGPLSTLIKRKKRDREEYPFTLRVDGKAIDLEIRVRGNSRVSACQFPPLRLNFTSTSPEKTPFTHQEKLKLVTHCRNGSETAQDSVLNEFTAYRIFNLISDRSYRVRLLRIQYTDTDDRQRKLEEPHYGFLIESDMSLASRLTGNISTVGAVRFSNLDDVQTARMQVFQYLIGNKDWSFVTAERDENCCHNIDLFELNETLVPVPYDFDLSALSQSKYLTRQKVNQSKKRHYSGYCRTPTWLLDKAIEHTLSLEDEIMATAEQVPAFTEATHLHRERFLAAYFKEAADKSKLLEKFNRDCIGRN